MNNATQLKKQKRLRERLKILEQVKQLILNGNSISAINSILNKQQTEDASGIINEAIASFIEEVNQKYPSKEAAKSILICGYQAILKNNPQSNIKIAALDKIGELLGLTDLEKAIDIVETHGYKIVEDDRTET